MADGKLCPHSTAVGIPGVCVPGHAPPPLPMVSLFGPSGSSDGSARHGVDCLLQILKTLFKKFPSETVDYLGSRGVVELGNFLISSTIGDLDKGMVRATKLPFSGPAMPPKKKGKLCSRLRCSYLCCTPRTPNLGYDRKPILLHAAPSAPLEEHRWGHDAG